MVQKQAVRSRSKSSSRKASPQLVSSSTTTSQKKIMKNNEKKYEKEFEITSPSFRRVTRQSMRTTVSSSSNDWEVTDTDNQTLSDRGDQGENYITEKPSDHKKDLIFEILKGLLSIVFIFLFPVFIFQLNKMCEDGGELRFISFSEIKLEYFTNWNTLGFSSLWLLFLSLLSVVPIGSSRSISLPDGFQLRYRCNGTVSLIVSTVGLCALLYTQHLTTEIIYDHYYSLIGSSIILTVLISSIVYLKSFMKGSHLVANSGNVVYSFLMGREINPRILGLDLKYFYEFSPGFISWALLNIVFCVKDWEDHEYKSINFSLLLCAFCQFVYCFDSLLFEGEIISKSFMISGRFGYVHCFGSQVVVPFLFTVTSRTIQANRIELPEQCLVAIALLNMIGFVIYRASNSQKNDFRRNPYGTHLSHLRTVTTEKGRQILAGGWWGILRHPNYTGDILMSVCWSLCAGFSLAVCWIYPAYFLVFMVVRCLQDDRACLQKHGAAWRRYTSLVPYRLVPFLF